MTVSFEQAAWSWTEHLRAGGARPWAEWVASGEGHAAAVPDGWAPPGAAQLEFVRRAAAVTGSRAAHPRLADLVFGRSGPARGLANLPLGWPGITEPRPFGPPLTDPADVPGQELIRVGVGVLSELLLREPGTPDVPWRVRRSLLVRDPAFELAGSPVTTAAVRRDLAVAGHVEGGRTPRVALLAAPFDFSLVEVWSSRVQHGAPARWRGFVARASRRLPPSADVAGLARYWSSRVGPERVHVVVAPDDPDTATRVTAEVLGLSRPAARGRRGPVATPPPVVALAPAAVDLVRRVNAVLAVRATDEQHAHAVRRLSTLLRSRHDGTGLTVPEPFQEWARACAQRMTDDLRRGGYAVHGDLDRLVPAFGGLPTQPDRDAVLRLALAACVDLASPGGHSGTKEERDR